MRRGGWRRHTNEPKVPPPGMPPKPGVVERETADPGAERPPRPPRSAAGAVYRAGFEDGVKMVLDHLEGKGDGIVQRSVYRGPMPVELCVWLAALRRSTES